MAIEPTNQPEALLPEFQRPRKSPADGPAIFRAKVRMRPEQNSTTLPTIAETDVTLVPDPKRGLARDLAVYDQAFGLAAADFDGQVA